MKPLVPDACFHISELQCAIGDVRREAKQQKLIWVQKTQLMVAQLYYRRVVLLPPGLIGQKLDSEPYTGGPGNGGPFLQGPPASSRLRSWQCRQGLVVIFGSAQANKWRLVECGWQAPRRQAVVSRTAWPPAGGGSEVKSVEAKISVSLWTT